MKKVFIFSICDVCNEPIATINPCDILGYNNFPETNFHGELNIEQTEKIRQKLIQSLKDDGNMYMAEFIEKNTKVMEVSFINVNKNNLN